jgi:hypothetical protein
MDKIIELKQKYLYTEATAEEILREIFEIYAPSERFLNNFDLEIKYKGYGIHNLYQRGIYISEGEYSDCLEEAYEITKKLG